VCQLPFLASDPAAVNVRKILSFIPDSSPKSVAYRSQFIFRTFIMNFVKQYSLTFCGWCLGRKEILDGMLGANLICFQVRDVISIHSVIE